MALDLNKHFKTDELKEREGIWEDLGEGAKVLIARIGNKNYTEAYRKVPKGVRRMIERGALMDSKVDDLICELIAATILLDWKEIEMSGKVVKYSPENAKKLLLELPEFREFIWEIANDFQRFHDEGTDADAKNSSSASSGKSNTED